MSGVNLLGTIHIWSVSSEGKLAKCARNKP